MSSDSDEFDEYLARSAEHDERLARSASNFTDQQIFDRWCLVGVRLAKEMPEHREIAYQSLLSVFENVPPHVHESTAENWENVGDQLIAKGRRVLVFIVATRALLMLDGARGRGRA